MCRIQVPDFGDCEKLDGIHMDSFPGSRKVIEPCKNGTMTTSCNAYETLDTPSTVVRGPCPRCPIRNGLYHGKRYHEYCRAPGGAGREVPREVQDMLHYGAHGQFPSDSQALAQHPHHMASSSQHAGSSHPSPSYQMASTITAGMGQQPYHMASSGQYGALSPLGYMVPAPHPPAEGQYAGYGQAAGYYEEPGALEGADHQGPPQQYVNLAELENQPREPSEEHEATQGKSSSSKKGKKSSRGTQETRKDPRQNDRKGGGGGTGSSGGHRKASDRKARS